MAYHVKKTLQELNLEDDFLFSKVMRDPEICRKVLEKILNIKIKKIKYVNEQKSIDVLIDSKAIRLDVYVEDEKETIYNIEMQRRDTKDLAKRSRYYQSTIDIDALQKGGEYGDLNKSFIIFICTFDLFEKGRHLYTFENRCIEDSTLKLNDETTKIFLNTKGFLDDVDDEMKEFLTYIENSTDTFVLHSKSDLVHDVHHRVTKIKKDKRLEVEYMTLYERYKEEFENGRAEGFSQGHQEGMKEGLKEGIREGIIQGIEQGIEQGQKQGAKQEKLEIAKNLLDILDDETISLKTGLSAQEVCELRKESSAS